MLITREDRMLIKV